MKHQKQIEGYDGTISDLARAVALLHHETREEFLRDLNAEVEKEAKGDGETGRPILASFGYKLAEKLAEAAEISAKITNLTRRYEFKARGG